MTITFITHARGRLEKYNISQSLVVDAINNPDEVLKGKKVRGRQRWVAHKLLNNKMLRIIYEVEDEDLRVITLYLCQKERYYKGGIREDKV